MPYQKCKIYNDGSHFIAIPHTTRPAVPKCYHPEEVIEVVDNTPQQPQLNADKCNTETALKALKNANEVDSGECSEQSESPPTDEISKPTTTRKITRRQLFDELYEECKSLKKHERKKFIYDRMKQYFANAEAAKQYVDGQFDRLKRNAIAKRVRLVRKVNLQTFNYFCTVTYFYGHSLYDTVCHSDLSPFVCVCSTVKIASQRQKNVAENFYCVKNRTLIEFCSF